jgi:hypothetical protein
VRSGDEIPLTLQTIGPGEYEARPSVSSRSAFVTANVAKVVGTPARTFRQWAADRVDAFQRLPAGSAT